MDQAVIKSGNAQYLVSKGSKVKLEKVPVEEGKNITFKEVLLVSTDKDTSVGTPVVKGAYVEATVLRQAKAPKITGVKMKAKKRRKKYFGHRQPFTEVEITKIAV